ncbi:hypothetical protein ACGFNV_43780 [Streptomyces sp. NPDC048751]|uniref:hypothetical protein n=1 Tax=Streptomyces sp. NPDC048751 TaxID=3365591 RepID=UPI00371AD380
MDLVIHDCLGGCTTQERDAFYASRPGPRPSTLPRHDSATRYRVDVTSGGGRTAYLVRYPRTWWRPAYWEGEQKSEKRPLDYFLWLRATAAEGRGDLAEKIMNDVFRQRPADGA